jgi:Tol biopolymer transport system component
VQGTIYRALSRNHEFKSSPGTKISFFQSLPGILHFAPDGKAVAHSVVENGVGNIWAQPLDGSKGHWLTTFTSDRIRSLQFSPDGKTLGVVRSQVVSDVVLLRDSSTSPR